MGLLDIGIDAKRRGKRESWRWRPRLSSAASKAMSAFKLSAPKIRTYTPKVTAGSPFSTRHSVAREMAERSATRDCVNLRRLRARRSRSPRAARSSASSGKIFGDLAGIMHHIMSVKTVFVNNVRQITACNHHYLQASPRLKRHKSWHLLFMIGWTDHGEAGIAPRGVDPRHTYGRQRTGAGAGGYHQRTPSHVCHSGWAEYCSILLVRNT